MKLRAAWSLSLLLSLSAQAAGPVDPHATQAEGSAAAKLSEARFQVAVTEISTPGKFSAHFKMPAEVKVDAAGSAFYIQKGLIADSITQINRADSYCHVSFRNPKATGRASRVGMSPSGVKENLFKILALPSADDGKTKFAELDGPMLWDSVANSAYFNFKTKAPITLSVSCPIAGAVEIKTVADLYRKLNSVLGADSGFEILFK